EIRDEFTHQITNNKVITILKSRGFFDDMQYLTEILVPIKSGILEQTESNELNINDIYTLVNSMFDDFEEDNDSQDEEIDQLS
ncbi:28727_t:CDS:2, partial [Dentiscutata erythropus]